MSTSPLSSKPLGPSKSAHEPEEVEAVVRAIRDGLVDAVLIDTPSGERVYSLHPFGTMEEHNEMLQAIRSGRVDALLINTPMGERVFSLHTTDEPYRILVETMQEGAATLDAGGTVLYVNARFAEMMSLPMESLVGHSLHAHFGEPGEGRLQRLIQEGFQGNTKGEVDFHDAQGRHRAFRVALSPLVMPDHQAVCIVFTDVTELFEANVSLRALSSRLLQLQDEERRRISRELHDSAGQNLAVAMMVLGEMEQTIPSSPEAERLRPLVESARKAIQECSDEIRTLSYLLHPPTLDLAGLRSALQWYSQGFSQRSGITVDLEITPTLGRLQEDVEITIYRIVQEALTNIHRHSGSKWAAIRLIQNGDRITLEVADRGKGMPSISNENTPIHMGMGTTGMRERVRQLNGHFAIESSEKGTTVRVTLTLADAANPRQATASAS